MIYLYQIAIMLFTKTKGDNMGIQEQGMCPYCQTHDITYGDIEKDGDMLAYVFTCNACNRAFRERYELTYSETVEK